MAGERPPGRGPLARLARAFDREVTTARHELVKRMTVYAAVASLVAHVALIAAVRRGLLPERMEQAVGGNYLDALATPFSIVLFYEVLLLILAIPRSTTRSLGKQFEIMSLIVIRNVFKDIAAFHSVEAIESDLRELGAVAFDALGGLGMFLLVALFYRLQPPRRPIDVDEADAVTIARFIEAKKAIALALSLVFFVLAAVSFGSWCIDAVDVVVGGHASTVNTRTLFYADMFTAMIFADVVVLILSLLLPSSYELVFRNAAFIVATILLRIALVAHKPYDVIIALGAVAFGTGVLAVYGYTLRVLARASDAGGLD